jgi:hypothetical protein
MLQTVQVIPQTIKYLRVAGGEAVVFFLSLTHYVACNETTGSTAVIVVCLSIISILY